MSGRGEHSVCSLKKYDFSRKVLMFLNRRLEVYIFFQHCVGEIRIQLAVNVHALEMENVKH